MRKSSWSLLRRLGHDQNLPRVIVGDFNEIFFSFEKQRGRARPQRQMESFRSALSDCELHDLGFKGRWYTWERGKFATTNIRERFDRGVANGLWWDLFPDYSIDHLVHSFSDHCLLLVTTKALSARGHGGEVRSFKFNADWCVDMECENLIKDYLLSTDKFLPDKLNGVILRLTDWNRNSLRNHKAQKVQLEKRLVELSIVDPSDETLFDSINVRMELNREDENEEIY